MLYQLENAGWCANHIPREVDMILLLLICILILHDLNWLFPLSNIFAPHYVPVCWVEVVMIPLLKLITGCCWHFLSYLLCKTFVILSLKSWRELRLVVNVISVRSQVMLVYDILPNRKFKQITSKSCHAVQSGGFKWLDTFIELWLIPAGLITIVGLSLFPPPIGRWEIDRNCHHETNRIMYRLPMYKKPQWAFSGWLNVKHQRGQSKNAYQRRGSKPLRELQIHKTSHDL